MSNEPRLFSTVKQEYDATEKQVGDLSKALVEANKRLDLLRWEIHQHPEKPSLADKR